MFYKEEAEKDSYELKWRWFSIYFIKEKIRDKEALSKLRKF
jgi:hypothetical protein